MSLDSPAPAQFDARWPRTPEKIHRWEQGPSSATALLLNPHVMGIEVIGTLGRDAIPVIMPPVEELIKRSRRAHLFWDAEELTNYDAEVRDAFVQMFLSNRSKWDGLHILFRSALIGMTVGAVGLVFRGALKSYREPDKFFDAVERALASTEATP